MKGLGFLLVFLVLNFTVHSQKLETTEMLGHLVFDALKEKNQELFKKAWMSKADFKFAMIKTFERRNQSEKIMADSIIDKIINDYNISISKSFSETISDGESDGIKWIDVLYSKTDYYRRPGTEGDLIEIGKVYLEIIYKDKKYLIKIGDSLKLKENWSIEDRISWKGLVVE